MTVRTVQKQLAGMEDLAAGIGKVVQQRAGAPVVIGKMDVPYAVLTEADLKALDVTKFAYARLNLVEYRYDDTDGSGIVPDVGGGSWLPSGIVLLAPDGGKWKVVVDNAGALSTELVT